MAAARRSEGDHRLPYPLRPTADGNLQNTQKRWHRAKHDGGWTTRLLSGGTIRWTSPAAASTTAGPSAPRPPSCRPAAPALASRIQH